MGVLRRSTGGQRSTWRWGECPWVGKVLINHYDSGLTGESEAKIYIYFDVVVVVVVVVAHLFC